MNEWYVRVRRASAVVSTYSPFTTFAKRYPVVPCTAQSSGRFSKGATIFSTAT
jgi:hypothetical protein